MDINGHSLGSQNKDDVQLVWENWDGLAPWDTTNDKIAVAKNFIHRIMGDASLGAECRPLNLTKYLRQSNQSKSLQVLTSTK